MADASRRAVLGRPTRLRNKMLFLCVRAIFRPGISGATFRKKKTVSFGAFAFLRGVLETPRFKNAPLLRNDSKMEVLALEKGLALTYIYI